MKQTDFDFKRIAQGYKERPFLHKQVIEQFQNDITEQIFSHGLDIGCGAGLSAKALRQICNHVTGADISSEMIEVAKEVCEYAQGYEFIVSSAEKIPAIKEGYDIATAAGVIQWVEQEPLLQNLKNIVNPSGYVVIYDFCISDQMKANEAYTSWWHDAYLKAFPKPFRNEEVWTDKDVRKYGFSMLKQVQYEMEYEFDRNAFIKFMMIQSNVNAKIEGEGRGEKQVREWFETTLTPIFGNEKKILIFKGYSWYLQNMADR